MSGRQILGSWLALLALAHASRAQTYSLVETIKPGDCFQISMDMSLKGEMRVTRGEEIVPLKLAATATHVFPERILSVASTGMPEKSARVYETAKAAITVGDDRSERGLRAECRLLVAQRHRDHLLVYCPAGPLTQGELELTSEHFDTLALTGLLPGHSVSVGESWKIANVAAQGLCNFEALSEQNLTVKLEVVKDNVARVSVTGTATGIDLGAQVKLSIQAAYHFDLTAQHLTWLEWKQKDERDQGPASPATAVDIATTLKRNAVELPATLSDIALVPVPDDMEPPATMLQLCHRDPKARFEIAHGREWHLVGQTDEHCILRLLDRGDFLAQATVTPWSRAESGKHLSPDDFRAAMAKTPGWTQESELQAGEISCEGGRWLYRITALGSMDGVAVLQSFYLVAGSKGDQAVVLFTMTPKQAEKLGTRDVALAQSISFPGGEKPKNP